jgi:hypothetical protein
MGRSHKANREKIETLWLAGPRRHINAAWWWLKVLTTDLSFL